MYTTAFEEIAHDELLGRVQALRHDGVRFVQLCAEMGMDDALSLIYTFYDEPGARALNLVVKLVPGDEVPSIQGLYFTAFSYENETHDLFGVRFANMRLDFGGHFFNVACESPMTVITPEQQAAREKARKAKAAAEAKAAKAAAAAREKAEAAAAEAALEKSAREADAEAVAKVAEVAGGKAAAPDVPPSEGRGGIQGNHVIPSAGRGAPGVEGSHPGPEAAPGRRGDPSTPPLRGSAQDDRAEAPAAGPASVGDDRTAKDPEKATAVSDVIPSGGRGAPGAEGSHPGPEAAPDRRGDPSTPPLRGSAQDDVVVTPAPTLKEAE